MKVEFEDLQLSNANMSSKISDDERKIINYQQDISLLKKTNNQLKCSHRFIYVFWQFLFCFAKKTV